MRTFVIAGVLTLVALVAYGQVATVTEPNQITYSAAARLSQHGGFSAAGVAGNIGVFARSLGSAWDVGAESLFLRASMERGGSLAAFDLGATAIYGSAGGKLAGEGGIVLGDATDCLVWTKGILGDFRAIAAGTQIGRVSLSGAYGNYFENRGDLGINLDRAGRYVLTAGWSSALGWNGGVKIIFVRKKP
jgi:hypothetical protein